MLDNLEKYADRIFFLKEGEFIYESNSEASEKEEVIYLKFSSRNNDNIIKKIETISPLLEYKILSNERVIMSINQFSNQDIIDIQNLLTEQFSVRSQIGNLDLADRYSLNYY